MQDFVDTVVSHYGPIAFGLVSLLIIWERIVKPQLTESKVDSQILLQAAEINRATANTLLQTVKGVESTASLMVTANGQLWKAVDRLNRIAEVTTDDP